MSKKIKRTLLSLLLVAAAFCACYFGGVTYSYYHSHKTNNGSISIAPFKVTVTNTNVTLNVTGIKGKNEAEHEFTVQSVRGVAVVYDVIVTFPEALPSAITSVTLEGKSPIVNGLVYTFEDVHTFTAEGGKKTHQLRFTADNSVYFKKITNIAIAVRAEQVNPS